MRIKTDLFVWIFLLVIITFSCKTTGKSAFIEDDGVQTKPREAVAIVTPRISKKKFANIDPLLLEKIENALFQDLQVAIATLKREQSLSNDEESLLRIAYALQAIIYQEKIDESLYIDSKAVDPYIAIILAAKKGAYDFNATGNDFFSLTFPSLVLLTAPGVQNFYNEAYIALEKALELHPESFLAEYLFAILLEKGFSLDEALVHFKIAYNRNSSFIPVIVRYMKALYAKGETKDALQKALEVLAKEEHNLDALVVAAQTSYSQKNYDAAETYVSRLLQREPNNNEYILFRARILMAKEEFMKVSSLLDIYAKTDKTAREYLLLKALLQRDWNKNPTAAASTLQEALVLYPQDLELLLIAATVSAQLGQNIANMSLEELLGKVFQKEPNNTQAITILVGEDILQERWEAAYLSNSKLYKNDKKEALIVLNQIKICLALGKITEARDAYNHLRSLTGETEDLLLCNIRILIAENASSQAISQIERLLGSTTNTRTKSALYYERSKVSRSSQEKLDDLRLSLTANPRNADALYSLYLYYFDQKEYRKAQYYLKQAVSLNTNSKILLERNKELDDLLAE